MKHGIAGVARPAGAGRILWAENPKLNRGGFRSPAGHCRGRKWSEALGSGPWAKNAEGGNAAAHGPS